MSDSGMELSMEVGDPEVISGDDYIPTTEDYVPVNVDKTPTAEDGEQPEQKYPLTQYGVLPEVDPYG